MSKLLPTVLIFNILILCSNVIRNSASVLPDPSSGVPLVVPASGVQGPLGPKPKQTIQQFQVVVLPPGAQPPQGGQAPGAAPPGFVWVQLPASYFPTQTSPPPVLPTQQPGIVQPTRPALPPQGVPRPTELPVPSPTTVNPEASVLVKHCLKNRGQFPSNSCNTYVNCWDGVAVEQFCPEGLFFSHKGYCDYPENVNCGGKPIQGLPPPVSTDATILPGQSSPPPTPPPAPVGSTPPTVIITLPPVDPNLKKKCQQPRGQFPSDACNKYVNCWDDIVIEQECPEGLLFSTRGYCDYPYAVDCKNRLAPPRTVDGNSADKECLVDVGSFRDRENCSLYYTCMGGKVVANYTCPVGFSFNDNIGVCDYEYRVDCSKEPLMFNPKANFLSNIPKDFMDKIDGCTPGAVFRLNPQCTSACLCRDGLSEVIQCPDGLAYDSKTDKCLLPHLAKC